MDEYEVVDLTEMVDITDDLKEKLAQESEAVPFRADDSIFKFASTGIFSAFDHNDIRVYSRGGIFELEDLKRIVDDTREEHGKKLVTLCAFISRSSGRVYQKIGLAYVTELDSAMLVISNSLKDRKGEYIPL